MMLRIYRTITNDSSKGNLSYVHAIQISDLPLLTLLLLLGIMVLSGLIHGTLGLGFPMIATPLLSLLFDVRSAILITLLPTVVVNLASIFRGGNWRQSIAIYWPLPLYALTGAIAGSNLIAEGDPAPYKLLLALLIILYLATQLLGTKTLQWNQSRSGFTMLGFGLLAGLAAGSTNVMVPILIIYTLGLGLQPTVMVQVFNMTFLAGKVAQIGVFASRDFLDLQWLLTTTPLALAALLALFSGMVIRDHIPTELFRQIIRGLLVVIALTLIIQYFQFDGNV